MSILDPICYNKVMKILELNRPAIHQANSIKELNVQPYTQGQMYMTPNRIVGKCTTENPAYRIVKPYELDGKKYAISMLITATNIGKAEKWLDKISESITEKQINDAKTQVFVYLEERYKA
jgi:hypothetical protein